VPLCALFFVFAHKNSLRASPRPSPKGEGEAEDTNSKHYRTLTVKEEIMGIIFWGKEILWYLPEIYLSMQRF
jgi:hypothetical protein